MTSLSLLQDIPNLNILNLSGASSPFVSKVPVNWDALGKTNNEKLPSDTNLFASTHISQATTGTLQERSITNIEEQLFDNRAQLKIVAASVGMYLKEKRGKVFNQIDRLLDADEWDDGDSLGSLRSFETFLRFFVHYEPNILPGLGLSSKGIFIGAWTSDICRLTLEFLTEDQIRWVVSNRLKKGVETAAGITRVERVKVVLSPYDIVWF